MGRTSRLERERRRPVRERREGHGPHLPHLVGFVARGARGPGVRMPRLLPQVEELLKLCREHSRSHTSREQPTTGTEPIRSNDHRSFHIIPPPPSLVLLSSTTPWAPPLPIECRCHSCHVII